MKLSLHRSLLPLIVLALACSEGSHVLGDGGGELDAAGGAPEGSGGLPGGTGGWPGGSGNGVPNAGVGGGCNPVPLGELEPPFASPDVVWERISLFVAGEVRTPPSTLPDEVTVEWAGDIALQAFDRELEDQPSPAGLRRFIALWLSLPAEPYPSFDRDWAALAASDGATLQRLLTFQVTGEPDRVGIFTDSHWLSEHQSIGMRSLHMVQALFPEQVPPPPVDFEPEPIEAPGMTRREAYMAQINSSPVCVGCHDFFDPYGFSVEHFDELGQYRTTDQGLPVDSSGTLQIDGIEVSFDSIADLSPRLAESCQAGRALSRNFLADALLASGTAEADSGTVFSVVMPYETDRERVHNAFLDGGRTFRSLVEGAARSEAMLR